MFPDRVDKIILNGVQNRHKYYHALANFEEWTDPDKAFSAIFEGCVAAPENCDLALRNGNGKTAAELEQAMWDALDALKRRLLALGNFMLDNTSLKDIITQALSVTGMGGGDVLDPEFIRAAMGTRMALLGIHCGERTARAATLDDVMPAPRERYGSRFDGVRTRGPVLFVGNTYDAHTPRVSAYNVSSEFEGSVALQVNGYGIRPSPRSAPCGPRRPYWPNGSLPDPGAVCETDMPPYSNVSWADVTLAAASSLARRGACDVPNLGRIARRGLMY
ncbi:hypothetical protein DL766_000829 [Monosporascus sp. MC13-8B]|nr:hypothetical protein DL763_004203 [Monosporascus cannonballus]RYP38619.1 hypothetical protein DL766_000829 [Monosporascus sp. MC13-8B]